MGVVLGALVTALAVGASGCATVGHHTQSTAATPPAYCAKSETTRNAPKLILVVVVDLSLIHISEPTRPY